MTNLEKSGSTMIKVTTRDIKEYGMNLFGAFVETEAIHSMETDKVTIKLVFNNTVYQLEADFNDFLTEAGCANAWGTLLMRCLLNHEKGTKTIQGSAEDIQKIMEGKG